MFYFFAIKNFIFHQRKILCFEKNKTVQLITGVDDALV